MADTNPDPLENRTRANLAYMLVFGAELFLGYILYKFGEKMEILTLIIGLIGGTMIGAPIGVYFAGALSKKAADTTVTGDNTKVTNNPPAEVK